MPRRTPDQGVGPFEIRPGAEFKRLRGMNRSADPSSIPDDQFHLLTNVRLTPAGMIDRPGLLFPEHEAEEEGCITGMVEIDEVGVGLWLTPTSPTPNFPDGGILANWNETKSGLYENPAGTTGPQRNEFRTYNYGTAPPPSPGAVEVPFPRWGYTVLKGSYVALIKYRKRLLHLGTRTRLDPENPNDLDPGAIQTWACLWEVKLPDDEEAPLADYDLYQDLWQITDFSEEGEAARDMVTVFARADDPVTGQEQIAEHLFISRHDGKVFDFDGTTVQESLDVGSPHQLRLCTVNEIGVYAIGTDVGDTSTVAYHLDAVGGTWTPRTAPYVLNVNDLYSFAGRVFIISSEPSGAGWLGPRIFTAVGGGDPTFQYEWSGGETSGGLFFSRVGRLFAVLFDPATPMGHWYIWRETGGGDGTNWFQYPNEINWFQDFGANIYWVLVTAKGRTFFGGNWIEKDIGQGFLNDKEIIAEVIDWTELGGAQLQIGYYNPIPGERGPNVGTQALILAPEDIVLNDEEL
jgi:hypothetical protein